MTRSASRLLGGTLGAMVLGLASVPMRATQSATAASPTHVQLTRDEDFARTRALLGITGPPPAGASGSSPDSFNEAIANPFPRLPDPLRLDNGRRVTSAAMWHTRRRGELLEHFQRDIYGRTPTNTPKVAWSVLSTTREMNGDIPVITRQLIGRVDNSAYPTLTVNILASLSTPANAMGPVPVVLSFTAGGFGGGRGAAATTATLNAPVPTTVCAPANALPPPAAAARGGLPAAGAPAAAGRQAGAGTPAAGRGQTGPPAPQGPTSQQQALARGWGFASVNTSSVQADNGQGLTCGIIGLVNKGQPRALDDWGVLAAWAWGASRALDYFETDKAVDARRVALYGHSRWGKATLLASVLDERFAIAYVSSSGQGGAKLHRRKYGETVENVANTFYYWMAGNYIKFAGKWDSMPVDSHELIALMAPRPVFFSGGNDPLRNPDGTFATRVNELGQTVLVNAFDAWIDPKGTFMAAAAAGPVYELLGGTGLGVKAFPALDAKVITGDLGFHQHPGGHVSGPAWATFYAFASRHLRK